MIRRAKTVLKYAGVTAVLLALCSAESIVDLALENVPCNTVSASIGGGILAAAILAVGLTFAYEAEEDWA